MLAKIISLSLDFLKELNFYKRERLEKYNIARFSYDGLMFYVSLIKGMTTSIKHRFVLKQSEISEIVTYSLLFSAVV